MGNQTILVPKSSRQVWRNYDIVIEESHWEGIGEASGSTPQEEANLHSIHWENPNESIYVPDSPVNTNEVPHYAYWEEINGYTDPIEMTATCIGWETSIYKGCNTAFNSSDQTCCTGGNWEQGTLYPSNNLPPTPTNPPLLNKNYLTKENYLSEFITALEKTYARFNLDVYSILEVNNLLAALDFYTTSEIDIMLSNITAATSIDIVTNIIDGNVPANTLIPAGTTLEDYIRLRGISYLPPAFNNFSNGISGLREVGEIISSNTFTWGTTNTSNINPNSISISSYYSNPTTSEIVLFSSLPNSGTQIYNGNLSVAFKRNILFIIKGTNTNNVVFSSTNQITFANKQFYGEDLSSTINENIAENLRISVLKTSVNGDYIFVSLINGYKWLVFSSELVQPTSFVDPNNANTPVLMQTGVSFSITNSFGIIQNYIGYRSTNQLGGSITIRVS